MAFLKFSENLFLEVAEYKRLQKFLNEDGIKRHTLINTDTFGLVRQAVLPQIGSIELADSFYVAKAGTPFDEVIIGAGIAVDSDANLIINENPYNLQIPNDGLWHWIKISHKFDVKEKGIVSIDTFGNLTGVGTEFTNILRGQPNYPTKIKFVNSVTGNANVYEVSKVISDTSAILQGDFTAESNLEYGVYGTFTPGYPVPVEDQMIYQYDSVNIELVTEEVLGQAPNFLRNKEFYIARVRNNGVDVTLQDKRINWWETEAMAYLRQIDRSNENPLIGVEAVKYDIATSTRAKNIVELAWGFRTKQYTIDTSSKKISILIGNGGVYKDTSFFQSGAFNGWRLYAKNGSWRTIIDSQKTGTQIVITLDVLEPTDYSSLTFSTVERNLDQIFIAPPYESIEFRFRQNGADLITNATDIITTDGEDEENLAWPLLERIYKFNNNTPLARVDIPSLDECYKYNLTFRYKIFNEYTDWQTMPDDLVGHFDENSFDERGNLKTNELDRTQVPYEGHPTLGFIKICEHPNSFNNFQQLIDTGDLFAVNTTEFSNATPTLNFIVGETKRYQHFKGQEITLSADMYIHLNRTNIDGESFREGNTFYIHIEQWINLSTFKMRIVEDFIDPTNFTELANINANDMAFVRNNTNDINQNLRKGLFIVCTYNEFGHWIVTYSSDTTPKGSVRMVKNVLSDTFNSAGDGQKQGFWGWKLLQMNDTFPVGTVTASETGDIVGENSIVLTDANMPRHTHGINDPGHSHNVTIKQGSDDHSSGRHSNSRIDRDRTYSTTRETTGITILPSGQTNPTAVDKRPKRMKFLFIEKIV